MKNVFDEVIQYIKDTGYNPYSDNRINYSDLFYIDTLLKHYSTLFNEINSVLSNNSIHSLLELGSYMSVGCHLAKSLGVDDVTASDMYKLDKTSMYRKWLQKKDIKYQGLDLTVVPETSFQEKYDCIIFQETLEHIPCNPARTLINVNQMLKDNGHLIFSVPNFHSLRSMVNILKFNHPYIKKEEFLDIDSVTEKSGVHWVEFDTKLIKSIVNFCNYEIVSYKKNNINYGNKKRHVIKNLVSKIIPSVFDQHRFILKKSRPYDDYLRDRKRIHAEHEAMNI